MGWKHCDSGGVEGRKCTIDLGEAKAVGARFVKAWSLEGAKSGGLGILSTSPGGLNCGYACDSSTALYREGELTLKAKPAKHFHLVEFTNGTGSAASCSGVTTEACTIASYNSNSSIEALFAEDANSNLTLSKEGGGQGFIKTKPAGVLCGYTCTTATAEYFLNGGDVEIITKLNKGTDSLTWTTGAGTCTGTVETVDSTCKVPANTETLVAKFE